MVVTITKDDFDFVDGLEIGACYPSCPNSDGSEFRGPCEGCVARWEGRAVAIDEEDMEEGLRSKTSRRKKAGKTRRETVNMSLLTEIADYDEGGSWGRMSAGWPEISVRARDVCVFASCVESVPYGSYVLMSDDCLRVHPDHIEQLRSDFKAAGEPAARESVERREKTGKLRGDGLREAAPKWWLTKKTREIKKTRRRKRA